jgi:hypothetical protein
MKTPTRPSKALTKAIEAALEAAYRAGWRDATSERKRGPVVEGKARLSSADLKRSVTAREVVLTALEAKPGLQPVEIYEWSKSKGLSLSFEAVRQAITRLGKKGNVVRSGQGYALKADISASK